MTEPLPDIIVRPLDVRKDLKEVHMLIGMSAMEQLAVANRRAYSNPLVVGVWLVFASIVIQVLKLWPTGSGPNGWLGYLSPLPPLACTAVPIMFAIDWLHRPHFERMLQERIKNFTKAISSSPSSPKHRPLFLVMEYKKVPIGCIALQNCAKSTSRTYRITHFHVDAPYRRAGVGHDFLSNAIRNSKISDADLVCVTSSLTPYVGDCLSGVGFKSDKGAVRVWEQEEEAEPRKSDGQLSVEQEKVFMVDTRRIGWKLSRA